MKQSTIINIYLVLFISFIATLFSENAYINLLSQTLVLQLLTLSTITLYYVYKKSDDWKRTMRSFYYALLSATIAECVWTVEEFILHIEFFFPSIVDVFYLLFYFFIIQGLYFRVRPHISKSKLLKSFLDTGIVMILAIQVFYQIFHQQVELAVASNGWLFTIFTGIYPILDIFVLSFFILFSYAGIKIYSPCIATFGGAMLFLIIGDTIFLSQQILETSRVTALSNIFKMTGYGLIGISGLLTLNNPRDIKFKSFHHNSWLTNFCPFFSMYVVLLILLWQIIFHNYTLQTLKVSVLALFLSSTLVIVRQALNCHENKLLASTDHLTGLYNYRTLIHKLEQDLTPSETYTLCWLDLDYFKEYNDKYGHLAGDQILIKISNYIKSNIRSSDFAFRYGGDEFIILIKDNHQVAKRVAERIREHFKVISQNELTLSIGIVEIDHSKPIKEILHYADQAMYDAKKQGKDKCIIFNIPLIDDRNKKTGELHKRPFEKS